jgi:hypothetical protein
VLSRHNRILPYQNIQNDERLQRRKIPPDQYFRLEGLVASLCQELGVSFVDLSPSLASHDGEPLFNERDHHLTPRGNKIAAREVAHWVQKLRTADSR